MTFLCYENCSTCRKAKAWLKERGLSFTERPIREENPTADELRRWIALSGKPTRQWFNFNGTRFKELHLRTRLGEMSEEEKIHLLAQSGMLVRRPVLVGDDFVLVGFKEAEWEEKLG